MRIYLAEYEVHSPIIFSSFMVPSKPAFLFITSDYLHNYALTYALMGLVAEEYGIRSSQEKLMYKTVRAVLEFFNSGRLPEVLRQRDVPAVIYAYPPIPEEIRRVQFYTGAGAETYGFRIGSIKFNYPRYASYVAIAPTSRYYGLVLSDRPLPRELYAELGMMRLGSIKATLYEVSRDSIKRIEGEATSTPVNVGDAELMGYKTREVVVLLSTKVVGENPNANKIGLVRTSGLYRISVSVRRNRRREVVVPLPPKLREVLKI